MKHSIDSHIIRIYIYLSILKASVETFLCQAGPAFPLSMWASTMNRLFAFGKYKVWAGCCMLLGGAGLVLQACSLQTRGSRPMSILQHALYLDEMSIAEHCTTDGMEHQIEGCLPARETFHAWELPVRTQHSSITPSLALPFWWDSLK